VRSERMMLTYALVTLSQWLDRGKGVASVRAFPGHAGRGEHSGVGVVA